MIYLDLLFLLNFFYDFFLLWTVGIILKRNINYKKMFLSSFIGALSSLIVIFNLNLIILFFYKIFVSVILVLFSFKFYNMKYTVLNLTYLYMCSVVLAGFLNFLDNQFKISYILFLIISPIILLVYVKLTVNLKLKQNLYHKVKVVFKNGTSLFFDGFIDSGNRLRDPITNKYIIIVHRKLYNNKDPIYVPYKSINKSGVLECFSLKYLEINDKKYNNYLLGVSDDKFYLDGANCLLNYKLLEDINV